jgi:hypothetical protein
MKVCQCLPYARVEKRHLTLSLCKRHARASQRLADIACPTCIAGNCGLAREVAASEWLDAPPINPPPETQQRPFWCD